jgi:hypothetical protein
MEYIWPVLLMAKCIKTNKDNIRSYKHETFFSCRVVSLHLACSYLRKKETARRIEFCMLCKSENYSKASQMTDPNFIATIIFTWLPDF